MEKKEEAPDLIRPPETKVETYEWTDPSGVVHVLERKGPDEYPWAKGDGTFIILQKEVTNAEWDKFLAGLSGDERAAAVRFDRMNPHAYFRSRYMQIRG